MPKKRATMRKHKVGADKAHLSENIIKRPKRQTVRPLESWRAERIIFGYKNGEIVNLGYEEGFPAVKSSSGPKKKAPADPKQTEKKVPSTKICRATSKKIVKTLKKEKKLSADPIKTGNKALELGAKIYVNNPSTGREESVYLHRPFITHLWSVPPTQDQKNPPFTMAQSITGEYISFGYVEIGVGKEKEEQCSPTSNITFTLIKGKINIFINNQCSFLNYLDKMTIPAGNSYKVKNIGKIPALLSFCSYKIPLFDYQFSENY